MKICQPHWGDLRKAIDERGLSHLVGNAQNATQRMADDLNRQPTETHYDPLLDANNMIWQRGLSCGGLRMLTADVCPLCEAEEHEEKGAAARWIKGCTDAVLKHCREKKLVPGVQ